MPSTVAVCGRRGGFCFSWHKATSLIRSEEWALLRGAVARRQAAAHAIVDTSVVMARPRNRPSHGRLVGSRATTEAIPGASQQAGLQVVSELSSYVIILLRPWPDCVPVRVEPKHCTLQCECRSKAAHHETAPSSSSRSADRLAWGIHAHFYLKCGRLVTMTMRPIRILCDLLLTHPSHMLTSHMHTCLACGVSVSRTS